MTITLTPGEIVHVLTELDALGLADAAPDVRRLVARAAELGERAKAAPSTAKATRSRVVAGLIDGSIAIADALDRTSQARAELNADAEAVALFRDARAAAEVQASQALADLGDRLVTDDLRPVAVAAITKATEAAAMLPEDVVDDSTAVAAGTKSLAAWAAMSDSYLTWRRAADVVKFLRDRETLPKSKYAPVQDQYLYEQRHPERAPRIRPGGQALHPVQMFALALRAGVDFYLYTAAELDERLGAEADARRADVERRRFEARRFQSIARPGMVEAVADEVRAEVAAGRFDRDPAA